MRTHRRNRWIGGLLVGMGLWLGGKGSEMTTHRAAAGEAAPAATVADGFPGWTPLHEPGCGGWMTGFAVAPDNPRHLLMGGDMLGIGVSTDQGDSWSPTFGLVSYEIADFTFHPDRPEEVWAGSMSGPYRSRDKGRTWTLMRRGFPPIGGGHYSAPIEVVRFTPGRATRLLAFGGSNRQWHSPGQPAWGAVWESVDDGASWTRLSTVEVDGQGVNLNGADFAAGDPARIYATSPHHGFFVSEDGGRTWTRRVEGLPQRNIEKLAVHPRDRDTAFVALGAGSRPEGAATHTPGGVFRTDDAGRTWRRLGGDTLPAFAAPESHFTMGVKGLAIARSDPRVLYCSTTPWNHNVLYRSTDGGDHWTAVATRRGIGIDDNDNRIPDGAFPIETAYFAGPNMTHIVIDPTDPDRVYASGSEYLLRSLDGGRTWNDATSEKVGDTPNGPRWRGRGYSGLCSTQFRFDPYRRGRAVLNAMDAGKAWLTEDGMASWRFHGIDPWPWGGANDTAFAKDGTFYVAVGQHGNTAGVLRVAPDGTTHAFGEANGLPPRDGHEGYGVHVRPDDARRAWVSISGRLFATVDGGATWRGVELPGGASWLAGDPTKSGRVYAAGSRGLWRSDDGDEWIPLGGPPKCQRMSVDAKGRALIATGEGERAGVWRYDPAAVGADEDPGVAWTRLRDAGLATNVVADPTDPTRLAMIENDNPYHDVMRSRGVWFSNDDGVHWFPANGGLPALRGFALAFDPFEGETVVCGTQGLGFYRARFPRGYQPPAALRERYAPSPEEAAADRAFARPAAGPRVPAVRNPSMSEGGGERPAHWDGQWGDAQTAADRTVFHSAPASLRVACAAGKSGQGFQSADCAGGETIDVSGWLKTEGDAKVNVAVQSFSANYDRNHFEQVQYRQGAHDWGEAKKRVTLPDWARHYNLVLLVEGDGRAWLDDVSVENISSAPPPWRASLAAAAAPVQRDGAASTKDAATKPAASTGNRNADGWTLTLHNGSMQGGGEAPLDWSPEGGARAFRDTAVFQSAPAALRVEGADGTVHQDVPVVPGKHFTLTGWFKYAGAGHAQVFAQFHRNDWSQQEFKQVRFAQGDIDWQEFRTDFTVPDWAERVKIGVLMGAGEGRAWLDDIRDAAAPVADARILDPRRDPLPAGKPWESGWCRWDFREAWVGAHEERVANSRARPDAIRAVFYGDSLTQGWNESGEAWAYFSRQGAVNYGQGGDSTRQILYRVPDELAGLSPKVVVLAIGTNNLYDDANGGSDEEIVKGVKACLDLIRAKAPRAKVILVAIAPRQNEWFMGRLSRVNEGIKAFADGRTVHWFDLAPEFRTDPARILPDGNLKKAYDSGDQLHLSVEGYRAYRDKLAPLFDRLMKE